MDLLEKIAVLMSGGRLNFLDEFTRSDGDLAGGWDYTAGKWTVATNAAVGTPGLGADVVVNGGFGADTDWTKGAGWSIAGGVGVHAAGTASHINQDKLTAGIWYKYMFDVIGITAGTGFKPRLGTDVVGPTRSVPVSDATVFWAANTAPVGVYAPADTAGTIDNVRAYPVTMADMFCTRNFGKVNVDISVPVTLVSNTFAGIVLCLDSTATPANYVLAMHNGTSAALFKCVAGTYTTLIFVTTAYGDGRILRVVKSGTSVSLYYNGVQIGATQTVSNAGIISNTRHGMFSTYSGNTFASFTAVQA